MTVTLREGISDWPTAGFPPGVRMNPDTLLPVVVNEEVMESALAASEDPRGPHHGLTAGQPTQRGG